MPLRFLATISAVLLLLVLACRNPPLPDDPRVTGWQRVIALKRVATSSRSAQDRQRYADAVIAFLREHPTHNRARTVYQQLQLERARELAAAGDLDPAITICRQLLRTFPDNREAREELSLLENLRVVSPSELAQVEKGMTARQLSELLGPPPKGWRRVARKGGTMLESLFYRNEQGGVAAVHLENGRVFAVDYNAQPGPYAAESPKPAVR